MDYSRFECITIDSYEALFAYKTSNFYKFCVANNLANLKEIFEFFDNDDYEIKNKNSRAEITGIIKLLRYSYLGNSLSFDNILNCKCEAPNIFDEESIMNGYLYYKYRDIIRQLGLNKYETVSVCDKLEYNKTIGDAILKLYKLMLEKPYLYFETEHHIFVGKVEILAKYYLAYKNSFDDLESLRKEIDSLVKQRDKLNALIEQKSKMLENIRRCQEEECKSHKKVYKENIAKQ